MATTLGGKKIVTKASGHKAPCIPAVSLFPPQPAPVPTPIPFIVQSSKAKKFSKKCLKINDAEVVVKGTTFDVESPGNTGSQSTGADLISHVEVKEATADEGDGRVQIDSQPVATTTHRVRANMPTGVSSMHQANGFWIEGGGLGMGPSTKTGRGSKSGSASDPNDALSISDPVAVSSGAVVDRARDLSLVGPIAFALDRRYSSAAARRVGLLGAGGFRLSVEAFVHVDPENPAVCEYQAPDGRRIWFDALGDGEQGFHRRERLRLERDGNGYTLHALDERQSRLFTPTKKGGPAVLREIRDGYGNTVHFEYQDGALVRVVGAAGRALRFSHEHGRVVRVELLGGDEVFAAVTYAYGALGELVAVTDPLGFAERYAYDGEGRLTGKTLRNGLRMHYQYGEGGRCVQARGDGGLHEVSFEYDLAARTTTASGTVSRRYTWDEDGFVVREETLAGLVLSETEFDEDHHPTVVRSAGGVQVGYQYDALGNLIEAVDPNGNVTRFRYEQDVLRERIDLASDDARPPMKTRFGYDGSLSLCLVRYPSGVNRAFTRDAHGRVVVDSLDGMVLAEFAYDEHGNVVRETSLGGATTEREYDALGRTVFSRDGYGNWVRTEYDARSQPIRIEQNGLESRLAFTADGLLAAYEDDLGRRTRIEYAGTGVPVRLEGVDGQVTRFEYDQAERIRKVENPLHETWEYVYDRVGRVIEVKTFDERRVRYAYDDAGRVARITHPDGGIREFAYDPLGFPIEDRTDDTTVVFERDASGFVRVARATDAASVETVVAFERDAFGRVVVERQGEHTLRYTWDSLGRVVARTLPDGTTTRYVYDATCALSDVHHGEQRVSLQRDTAGNLVRLHLHGAGVDVMRRYSAELQLEHERVTHRRVDGQYTDLVGRSYDYDAQHRPATVRDDRWGRERFVHDTVGRLLGVEGDAVRAHLSHDPTGSILALSVGDAASRHEVAAGNVLRADGSARYETDERNRRVRKIEPGDRVTTYEWDGRDRLRSATLPDGTRVLYTYDALGRRTKKVVVGPIDDELVQRALAGEAVDAAMDVTETVWDGNALAMEIQGDGRRRAFVQHAASLLPLLQVEEGHSYLYVTDPLGVPRELVRDDGTLAWSGVQTPYGERLREEGEADVAPPFRLHGHVYDEDLGLCSTLHRWFDPAVGRFLTPDPLGIAGGENVFAFNGSPTTHVDPLGLQCYVLSDPMAATFTNGQYKVVVVQQDTVMHRAGTQSRTGGAFYDYRPAGSVQEVRRDQAVLPQWPNNPDGSRGGLSPIDYSHRATVTAGTVTYVGPIAPQRPLDAAGNSVPLYNPSNDPHPGGGNQVFIPWSVPRDGQGGTGAAGNIVSDPSQPGAPLPNGIILP